MRPSRSTTPSSQSPIWLIGVLCAGLAAASLAYAASTSRPFWAEKTSFIEGDDLFVVGVASNARTVEGGRKQAFENGKLELMHYAQVTNLEAQGLVIETQMTYEEPTPDGNVNVFRLLRVPVSTLVAIQGRLQTQRRAQEHTLEQTRQELESRARTIEGTLQAVSQLQVTLGEKAQKIEQQQRQVEQLLHQLQVNLHPPKSQAQQAHAAASLIDSLKQAEAQLADRERELDRLHHSIIERVRTKSQKACKYVTAGMTKSDVRQLVGEPDGKAYPLMNYDTWSYGRATVDFSTAAVVKRVDGC